MTPAAWIMLGAAIVSPIFTVIWWLVRRPVARIDRLEAAVFGESGVHMRMTKFATAEFVERKVAELQTAMRGISEEGQTREDRILKAIENQTLVVGSEMRELKQDVRDQVGELRNDVRQQANRVDALMQQQNGNR